MSIMRKTAAVFAAIIIFAGCGNPLEPFNPGVISQAKDVTPPVVTIDSPENDSVYGQSVTVSGTVTDDGALLPALKFSVSDVVGNQQKSGDIELTEVETAEGVKASFSFSFSTSEYGSDLLLEISGSDWNGNAAAPVKLRLVFSGSTIPSFSVQALSEKIFCSWEEVPGASSYKILYTTDGSIPQESYGESSGLLTEAASESAPYRIEGLRNGHPHLVRLIAYGDDGSVWQSALETVIPSSQLTFRPTAFAGEKQIELEWVKSSDYYGYEVYRSEGNGGSPVNISGTITENKFTDSNVVDGVNYFYYVRPAVPGAEMSAGAACAAVPLISNKDRKLSVVIEQRNIKDSIVSGDHAYLFDVTGNIIIYDVSNPAAPCFSGRWDIPFPYSYDSCLSIYGNYAYVGKANRIYRVDISNAAEPKLVDSVVPDDSGSANTAYMYDIAVRSGKLYALATSTSDAAAGEGVYIYNIESDGSLSELHFSHHSLERIGSIGLDPAGTGDVMITNRYGSSKPSVVLRMDPDSGIISDFIPATTGPMYYGAFVHEALNLVLCIRVEYDLSWSYYVEFRKLSDGTSFGADAVLTSESWDDAYIDGEYVYITQANTMTAMKLNKSADDQYSFQKLYEVPLHRDADGISKYKNYAVCGISSGLQVINTERKAEAAVLNPDAGKSGVYAVDVQGDLVYAGRKGDNILRTYSFADKSSPVLLGESTGVSATNVRELVAAGDYVFMTVQYSDYNGVEVFDVSDPATIVSAGRFSLDSEIKGIELFGDYLACYCNGNIEILNISDPSSIRRVSGVLVSAEPYGDIAVKGGYLFVGYEKYSAVSTSTEGLKVYDVSDPYDPVQVAVLDGGDVTDGGRMVIRNLTVSGSKLYGYSTSADLTVIDISNPKEPLFLTRIECNYQDPLLDISYSGIDSAGDYVFFNGWPEENNVDNGLHIYNTENTDLVERLEVNKMEDLCRTEGEIKLFGRYCYVAADQLICLDIAP